MAVSYDPTVIQKFAEKLYRQATFVSGRYALVGFLLGFLVGAAMGAKGETAGLVLVVRGLLGALVGAILARGKADALRLQAQTALCQVQIEANGRAAPVEAKKVA